MQKTKPSFTVCAPFHMKLLDLRIVLFDQKRVKRLGKRGHGIQRLGERILVVADLDENAEHADILIVAPVFDEHVLAKPGGDAIDLLGQRARKREIFRVMRLYGKSLAVSDQQHQPRGLRIAVNDRLGINALDIRVAMQVDIKIKRAIIALERLQ